MIEKTRKIFEKPSRIFNKIFLNPFFYLLLFSLACLITLFSKEVIGAVGFVILICLALVLCEDILATTLPFMLLCVFITKCYNSFDTFIKFWWIAIPAVLSILFHFVIYSKKIQLGSTFYALIAVSAALMLGGIGTISAADYFRPVSLFYVVFLGVGMVVAYILLKSQMCVERDYDVRARLLAILYIAGLLACVMAFKGIYDSRGFILTYKKLSASIQLQAKNNLSTFLMFAIPCPFFFASKNRFHIVSPIIMFAAILLSQSRGGIIFGSLELLLCYILFAIIDKRNRYIYIIIATLAVFFAFYFSKDILRIVLRKKTFSSLISKDEDRYMLLTRAWEGYKQNSMFGHGLGYTGNTDLYSPKAGALTWYHMIIPQIVGSLGSIGILAYGYQLFVRARTIIKGMFTKDNILICALGMSYVGVLLMSQVNPGLFCPLPYSLITVIIFALIDGNTLKSNE
ncbi:MAG: hypothetical protein E7653_00370 [Ruminococcaceae bacterium]|nr:hypothetical protein [Oscillospiraceae bacterium]